MTSKMPSLCRLSSAIVLTGVLASAAASSALAAEATTKPGFSPIANSLPATIDTDTGAFNSSNMTVEIVLAPGNQTQLSSLTSSLYNAQSPNYQQWLGKGEFAAQFAPGAATVTAITNYLQSNGLSVQTTESPFLLRASGPSSALSQAFSTTLRNYANRNGISYFQNASTLQLPSNLAASVLGVVGLTNTVHLQGQYQMPYKHHKQGNPPCETPYPTTTELFNQYVNNEPFPYGYGGGPGCNGLTPSQVNSIYEAPNAGARGQGQGVNMAVFELSAYQHNDIDTWAKQFYAPGFKPPLVDINVDGGPLNPICPSGDQCEPASGAYAGDIEVDADIEITLAAAPALRNLIVYNAPNDVTGQTELDEYTQIANDDIADVVSSSWSECEQDAGAALAQAENLVFLQMALQGQSVFGAEGDTGAFECIRSDGTTGPAVLDPPAQPWVTSVGGTSFESFNPGGNASPSYPYGQETVWNVDGLCSAQGATAGNDGQGGAFWCGETGAGGGGNSQFWGRPFFQFGPGIANPYTSYGNGSTQCALAFPGTPCREVPDVSANADEFTPYAEYCTGSASTPGSICAEFSGGQTPPGWFGIGGTSLASPLMSAIIGDRVGYFHGRVGSASFLIYGLYRNAYQGYFHDITGFGSSTNNNGLFPTTIGYDLATGVGSPKMGALITGVPQY
jgi:subtilase family serine protease